MSDYKIIFSDLDGTALDEESELSPENAAAITRLTQAGYLFIPCTGRALGEIPPAVRNHKDVRYLITSNGAATYDKETGTFIATDCIGGEAGAKILALISRYEMVRNIHKDGASCFDGPAFENYRYYNMVAYYHDKLYDCTEHVSDFAGRAQGDIELFCVFFKEEEDIRQCEAELLATGLVQVTASCVRELEITAKGVCKGKAMLGMLKHLGIPAEAAIAIGDSPNDLSMLAEAGLALATANAAAPLLEIADKTICHHRDHAIAYLANMLKI